MRTAVHMGKDSGLAGLLIALISLFWPVEVWAHLVNANVGEFYAGMLHPLTSAEHLLPTLALALITVSGLDLVLTLAKG